MSALAVFAFGEQMVRISDRSGEPWFVGRDICAALGHTNPTKSLSRIPADERDEVTVGDLIGRQQMTTIISEPGMYRLVLTSRTEAAEKFKTWVVTEVLPAIRKTGRYAVGPTNDGAMVVDPEMFDSARVFGTWAKLRMIAEGRKLHGDEYARDLWRSIGLPVYPVPGAGTPSPAGGCPGIGPLAARAGRRRERLGQIR